MTRGFVETVTVSVTDSGTRFSIVVDPKNGSVDTYIYMHHHWESHIGPVLQKHLPLGGVFVDVGANIGYFSLLAASLLGPAGKVIAFEPIPDLCKQINKSILENNFDTIDVRNCALGKSVGQERLGMYQHNIGGSALHATAADSYIDVPLRMLDSELQTLVRLDVMKIDVEGFEYQVLQGGVEILKKFQPIIILEFSPAAYALQDEVMAQNLLGLLEEIGYRFTILQTQQSQLDAQAVLSTIGMKQVDLLCIPKGKM